MGCGGMGRAKDLIVKVIPATIANDFVRTNHYSGKVVPNSQLHFGVFLDNNLHGVMSFGSPMDKRKIITLVKNTKWNEMLELNRMAFDDYLPKNSESRAIAIAIKLIKKNAPHIKWIISFADGTQCGDGTIYRASGFNLIKIKKNTSMWVNINTGEKMQNMQFYHTMTKKDKNWKQIEGNMLSYIYLIDKTAKLNVPIVPFNKIDELGARMYKGEKITMQQRKVNMDQSV